MSLQNSYDTFTLNKDEAIQWFREEISTLRTGRVKPDLVESLSVDLYGARTPLKGVATISNSDARTLVIAPWDPGALPSIKKAITDAQIGVNPTEDGRVVRLSFPMQTEESREQTIKMLHKKAEEARIRFRKGRDEALSILKTEKQDSTITEDDFYEGKEKLDAMITKASEEILAMTEKKETEIKAI